MHKRIIIFIVALLLPFSASAAILGVQQGGTASSSLTGILIGNGISPINTLIIGTNLSLTGTTLNATGGGGGSGNVATSSAETATDIPWWTSTNGTPAQLSGGSSSFQWLNPGFLDLASTTIGAGNASNGLTIAGTATTGALVIGGTISGVASVINVATTLQNTNNGAWLLQSGTTQGTPGYSFKNDTNTGLFDSNGGHFIGFTTNGAEAMRIVNGGEVGIGTTTPDSLLSIANVSGQNTNSNNLFEISSSTVGATTTLFSISNKGNVNVGAVPTTQKLNVDGPFVVSNSNISLDSGAGGTGTQEFRLNLGSGEANINESIGANRTLDFYNGSVTNLLSIVGVSNYVLFPSSTVGVGTSTPWGQLSASSTSAYPTLAIEQKSTGPAAIFSGGNVGIGTTTPGSLLSLNNIANFTTATSTFYGNGISLTAGCFAIGTTCIGTGSGTVNSGTIGQNAYYAGTGTTVSGTSSLVIASNQYVGIGTTTPWSMLSLGANGSITTTEASSTDASTINVNWLNGNQQKYEMNTNTTVQMGFNVIAGQTERLILCQDGTGSRAVTWGTSSSSIIWAGGTAPTQTTTAYACDVYSFLVTGATSTLVTFGAVTQNFQ